MQHHFSGRSSPPAQKAVAQIHRYRNLLRRRGLCFFQQGLRALFRLCLHPHPAGPHSACNGVHRAQRSLLRLLSARPAPRFPSHPRIFICPGRKKRFFAAAASPKGRLFLTVPGLARFLPFSQHGEYLPQLRRYAPPSSQKMSHLRLQRVRPSRQKRRRADRTAPRLCPPSKRKPTPLQNQAKKRSSSSALPKTRPKRSPAAQNAVPPPCPRTGRGSASEKPL